MSKHRSHKVLEKGQLVKNYSEQTLKDYMKNNSIKITLEINLGKRILLVILWILLKNTLRLIQIIDHNMIKYKLKCNNCNKSFDSWFASSLEFEKLKKKFPKLPFL